MKRRSFLSMFGLAPVAAALPAAHAKSANIRAEDLAVGYLDTAMIANLKAGLQAGSISANGIRLQDLRLGTQT